jgi:hypothetical protein
LPKLGDSRKRSVNISPPAVLPDQQAERAEDPRCHTVPPFDGRGLFRLQIEGSQLEARLGSGLADQTGGGQPEGKHELWRQQFVAELGAHERDSRHRYAHRRGYKWIWKTDQRPPTREGPRKVFARGSFLRLGSTTQVALVGSDALALVQETKSWEPFGIWLCRGLRLLRSDLTRKGGVARPLDVPADAEFLEHTVQRGVSHAAKPLCFTRSYHAATVVSTRASGRQTTMNRSCAGA